MELHFVRRPERFGKSLALDEILLRLVHLVRRLITPGQVVDNERDECEQEALG